MAQVIEFEKDLNQNDIQKQQEYFGLSLKDNLFTPKLLNVLKSSEAIYEQEKDPIYQFYQTCKSSDDSI